jgi:site-specific DNA-methyltransferase (adenine-specific)
VDPAAALVVVAGAVERAVTCSGTTYCFEMCDGSCLPPFHSEPLVRLYLGDCVEVMRTMLEASVDAIVTDPPYGLEFMGKEWDRLGWQAGGGFSKPGIGERETPWASFSATSRFGAANPTCAECGGRLRGAKKCTCSQPHDHWKPIGKRRDPENDGLPNDMTGAGMRRHLSAMQAWHHAWATEALRVLKPGGHLLAFGGTRTFHRLTCALEDAGFEIRDCLSYLYGSGFPKSKNIGNGWGTALKPAWEPIILARKPLSEPNVAANVQKWGTGAINVDGCRIAGPNPSIQRRETARRTDNTPTHDRPAREAIADGRIENRSDPETYMAEHPGEALGRWPANLVLDEEAARLLDEQSGESESRIGTPRASVASVQPGAGWGMTATGAEYSDSGGASRFFYTSKADAEDRDGTKHPTVKPVDLMKWLVTLVTPPGGTVLDPFMGSGTTIYAARELGFQAIGIEREQEYCADAVRRLRQGVLPFRSVEEHSI